MQQFENVIGHLAAATAAQVVGLACAAPAASVRARPGSMACTRARR